MSFSRAPIGRFNDRRNAPAASKLGLQTKEKDKDKDKDKTIPPPTTVPLRERAISPPTTQERTRSTSATTNGRTRQLKKSNTSLTSVDVQQHSVQAARSPSLCDQPKGVEDHVVETAPISKVPEVSPAANPTAKTTKSVCKVPSHVSVVATHTIPVSTSAPSTPRKPSRLIAQDRQNRRLIESQLVNKRKRFAILRKELLEKQRNVLELYTNMAELRERLLESGGRDLGSLDELKMVDLGQLKDLTGGASGKNGQEGAGEDLQISSQSLTNTTTGEPKELMLWMEKQLKEIPTDWVTLCRNSMEKRGKVLSCVGRLEKDDGSVGMELDELHKQLEDFQKDGDNLDRLLEEAQAGHARTVSQLLQTLCGMFNGEGGQQDLQVLQSQLAQSGENLTTEQAKNKLLEDKLAQLDAELKLSRQRSKEMEAKLSTDESRIQQLNCQVRAIEEQLHFKELSLDHKTKATSEVVNRLERQRENLETRVKNMSKLMAQKEAEAGVVISNLQTQLQNASTSLTETAQLRKEQHKEVEDYKQQYAHLEEEYNKLASTKVLETDVDAQYAKKELALKKEFARKEEMLRIELKTAIETIKSTKEHLATLEEEKIHFLDAAKTRKKEEEKAAHHHAAQSKQKEEQIQALSEQIKELEAAHEANMNPETNEHTQLQLSELQQQVADLQATLSEVVRHNEELEQTLVQKQLEVEQRERVMREQGKVLKVRDELICLLKGKEQRQDETVQQLQATLQDRDSNTDKVNQEVSAKAEELQGLYGTVEAKQTQVLRLEKLVKQLEEQQERSQAQRTRHEARIAQLELVLQNQSSAPRYAAGAGEGTGSLAGDRFQKYNDGITGQNANGDLSGQCNGMLSKNINWDHVGKYLDHRPNQNISRDHVRQYINDISFHNINRDQVRHFLVSKGDKNLDVITGKNINWAPIGECIDDISSENIIGDHARSEQYKNWNQVRNGLDSDRGNVSAYYATHVPVDLIEDSSNTDCATSYHARDCVVNHYTDDQASTDTEHWPCLMEIRERVIDEDDTGHMHYNNKKIGRSFAIENMNLSRLANMDWATSYHARERDVDHDTDNQASRDADHWPCLMDSRERVIDEDDTDPMGSSVSQIEVEWASPYQNTRSHQPSKEYDAGDSDEQSYMGQGKLNERDVEQEAGENHQLGWFGNCHQRVNKDMSLNETSRNRRKNTSQKRQECTSGQTLSHRDNRDIHGPRATKHLDENWGWADCKDYVSMDAYSNCGDSMREQQGQIDTGPPLYYNNEGNNVFEEKCRIIEDIINFQPLCEEDEISAVNLHIGSNESLDRQRPRAQEKDESTLNSNLVYGFDLEPITFRHIDLGSNSNTQDQKREGSTKSKCKPYTWEDVFDFVLSKISEQELSENCTKDEMNIITTAPVEEPKSSQGKVRGYSRQAPKSKARSANIIRIVDSPTVQHKLTGHSVSDSAASSKRIAHYHIVPIDTGISSIPGDKPDVNNVRHQSIQRVDLPLLQKKVNMNHRHNVLMCYIDQKPCTQMEDGSSTWERQMYRVPLRE